MEEKDLIIKFWKKEGRTTRNVLARIPEGSTYTPDPKSRPASEIAWQNVHEEKTLIDGLEKGVMEWVSVPAPATMRETLEAYDKHLATFADRLTALDTAKLEAQIPFMFGTQRGQPVDGLRSSVGLPVRHHPPPRPDHDLSPRDGVHGAAGLRTDRRRTLKTFPPLPLRAQKR